jgi:hypothetical protein
MRVSRRGSMALVAVTTSTRWIHAKAALRAVDVAEPGRCQRCRVLPGCCGSRGWATRPPGLSTRTISPTAAVRSATLGMLCRGLCWRRPRRRSARRTAAGGRRHRAARPARRGVSRPAEPTPTARSGHARRLHVRLPLDRSRCRTSLPGPHWLRGCPGPSAAGRRARRRAARSRLAR